MDEFAENTSSRRTAGRSIRTVPFLVVTTHHYEGPAELVPETTRMMWLSCFTALDVSPSVAQCLRRPAGGAGPGRRQPCL